MFGSIVEERLKMSSHPMRSGGSALIAKGYSVRSIINQWLGSIEKPATRRIYGRAIVLWGGFLTEQVGRCEELTWPLLLEADVSQAKAFLKSLTLQGIGPSTQATYLSALAGFYELLIHAEFSPQYGNVWRNPAVKLPRGARQPKRMSRCLTEEQVEAIFTVCDNDRDLAILALLFGAGLRKSEVLGLKAEHITLSHTDEGEIPVLLLHATKAHVFKPHSIAPWVYDIVMRYAKDKRGPLIPLSRTGLDNVFRKWVAAAGIEGKWSPHDARCSAINILHRDGVPMQQIQDFSRHSSVRMVETYVRRQESLESNPGRNISFGKIGAKREGK